MPVRACPGGFRWGRRGPVRPDPRSAYRDGLRQAARRMAVRGDARGRRVSTQPLVSEGIEDLYTGMLHARVNLLERLFVQYAGRAVTAAQAELDARREQALEAARVDASPWSIFDVLKAIRQVDFDDDRQGLLFLADEIDEDATATADRRIQTLLNVPLVSAAPAESIEGWLADNIALITSIQTESLDQVESLVRDAMSGGRPTRDLMADIQERFGVARSRASLIARDQTAKLASRIARERQEQHGITHFQWSTSGDARVRQGHAELDGRIFSWATGAPGGIFPGDDFQCRCTAEPVLSENERAELEVMARSRQEMELEILHVSPTVRGEIPNRSGFSNWNRARLGQLRRGAREAVGLGA